MPRKLLWHRNDLRLHDHEVLSQLKTDDAFLPVYCFNPSALQAQPYGLRFPKMGALRLGFLREHLQALRQAYERRGQQLIIRWGDPETVIPGLAWDFQADEVWTASEVTFEELADQRRVQAALGQTPLKLFSAHTLIDTAALPFPLTKLPRSFTGFRKRVECLDIFPAPRPAPTHLPSLAWPEEGGASPEPGAIPRASDFGLLQRTPDTRTAFPFDGGEQAALEHLQSYIWDQQQVASYKETRNGLMGASYSSKFSPWLAAGALSARQIYAQLQAFETEVTANDSTYWLFFELLWRDYFRLVAARHGSSIFQQGGIQHRHMHYTGSQKAFERWSRGETTNTFVNACMQELRLTGYLSNRGRQNAASYLCHDLKVDWRWGAAWFEHCLLDYDPCSNWGNWMYIAGVGNGGQNRQFDVDKQASYYDPAGTFQSYWLKDWTAPV